MGLRDEVTKPISLTICKDPRLAGHAFCGPVSISAKKTLEMLEKELGELDNSLVIVEYASEFRGYAHKIEELREKIGVIKGAISKSLAYDSLYEDSKQLLGDIRRIRLYDAENDPVSTAKAYGAAMQSLGRLIEKLPGVAGAVGTLIAEMGKISAKVVADIVPHTRQTNKNVSNGYKQGGVIIPGFGDRE